MKLLKILSFALVLCLVLSIFSGCEFAEQVEQAASEAAQAEADRKAMEPFEKIRDDGSAEIWRDKKTDVLYFSLNIKRGYGFGLGLNVMYHPDGTPLLYSEWVEMEVLPVGEANP